MTTNAEEAPFIAAMEHEPQPMEAQKPLWREAEISVTRGLWRTHAMVHGVLEIVSRLAGKVRSLAERGPGDFEEERGYERGFTAGRKQARKYNNGDDESGIRRWHLVLAVVSVVIPIMTGAWTLSMQISAQSAMISTIRDHQRAQDERATRVEQQIQQLTRDRR